MGGSLPLPEGLNVDHGLPNGLPEGLNLWTAEWRNGYWNVATIGPNCLHTEGLKVTSLHTEGLKVQTTLRPYLGSIAPGMPDGADPASPLECLLLVGLEQKLLCGPNRLLSQMY